MDNLKKTLKRIFIGKAPRKTFVRALILIVICIGTFKFVLIPVHLRGSSMEPTYLDGSFNFINALLYKFRAPYRGDVVAIKMAGKKLMLFKRIVALPGERVEFRAGLLFINGEAFEETYLKEKGAWNMEELTLKESEFFVVGDNRLVSFESNLHGRVRENKIIGEALW